MSLKRRILVGTAWSAAETWGQQLVNFLVFIVMARLLGPEAYGLVAMALIVTSLGELITNGAGFNDAIVYRRDVTDRHIDTVFWTLLAIGALLMGLTIAVAGPVARFFAEPAVAPLMVWLSPIMVLTALATVPTSLLRRKLLFRQLAVRSVASILVGGAVGIGMALAGWGVWALVANHLAQRVVALAVLWWSEPRLPRHGPSLALLADMGGYAASRLGTSFFAFFDTVIVRTLVGWLLGPVAVGWYAMAWRLYDILNQLVVRPIGRVAMPTFSEVQADPGRVEQVYVSATRLTGLFAFPCFLGLAVTAPLAVPLAFGAEWAPAAPVVQVFALMGVLSPIQALQAALLEGVGRPFWQFVATLAGSAVLVPMVWVASAWGLVWVAWALFLRRWLIAWPAFTLILRHEAGLTAGRQLLAALPPLAAAVLMALAVFAWQALASPHLPATATLAGSITLGALVFAAAAALLARPALREAWSLLAGLRRAR